MNIDLNYKELQYLRQTLLAIKENKARVGQKHYNVTISKVEMTRLYDKLVDFNRRQL